MKNQFQKIYPDSKEINISFCPYRVCPLGAHVDHQYGLITGFAIDKGIHIAFCETKDGLVEATSCNFPEKISFNINNIPEFQGDWADYIRGAAFALAKKYELQNGVKALIKGTLPVGGLSSSAALILAFMSALCRVNNIELSDKEKIYIAQAAENEYVGVSCGKLDQSCEVLCKKDHLLYLDNKTDEYELIPQNPNMPPYEIAVVFSGVERTLVGSEFNTRVDELKSASYALKAFAGMEYGKFKDSRLRDVPEDVYHKYKDKLPENWAKRAEHYYTEFKRVQNGVEAWKNGDIVSFGRLMTESGNSSIYNYETGSDELKAIHEIMLETDGIYGGRFSGAGFKGCCVALINPEYKESIKEKITKEYLKRFPKYKNSFSIHFCKTADGCR